MTAPYATARWPAAAATAAIWALAAASVVFWGLRWTAPPDAVVPPAATRLRAEPDPAAVARALGSASNQPVAAVAVPEAASRFALLGVVADADRQGAALIAVDGRPARPFKVGAQVADGFVLESVTARSAALGAGGGGEPILVLRLPTRPLAVMAPPKNGAALPAR
jgi:general secretion pathway protein C